MNTHRVLQRQLNKLNLSQGNTPGENDWQSFIALINKTYHDFDQERYLSQRSIDISSNELMTLNAKLEQAQHIAGLGYWSYDLAKKKCHLV